MRDIHVDHLRNTISRGYQPRYHSLASSLISEVVSGALTIGDTLASERKLAERFGASRYTVREALRLLEETGMITRRQGKNAVVTARFPQRSYAQIHKSFCDFLQYPAGTFFDIEKRQRIVADEKVAGQLHCNVGAEWLNFSGVQRNRHDGTLFCSINIYLDSEFEYLADIFSNEKNLFPGR